ncbi:MAG: hypothetical protein AAB758_00565 [Patescibacteria group bacterium]
MLSSTIIADEADLWFPVLVEIGNQGSTTSNAWFSDRVFEFVIFRGRNGHLSLIGMENVENLPLAVSIDAGSARSDFCIQVGLEGFFQLPEYFQVLILLSGLFPGHGFSLLTQVRT